MNYLPKDLIKLFISYLPNENIFYITKQWDKFKKNEIDYISAKNGWIDLFEWGLINGIKPSLYIYSNAAEYGHLEFLQYSYSNNLLNKENIQVSISSRIQYHGANYYQYFINGICSSAAYHGHFDIVKWIHKINLKSKNICTGAAIGGHLEILKWAIDNGCEIDKKDICGCAANGGHIEILEWLVDNIPGIILNEETIYDASKSGNLKAIKWLRNKGCPWDKRVCYLAEHHYNPEILKYIYENGDPCAGAYHRREGDK